jgi:diguanylate cyclase
MGWLKTIKFRIVLVSVCIGMLSAVASTELVMRTTQAELQQLLLKHDLDEAQRTAALLSSKLVLLENVLSAVAQQATAERWLDTPSISHFLQEKPALSAMFTSVFAAQRDGQTLVKLDQGVRSSALPQLFEREYFQRALQSPRPVVSRPFVGAVSQLPIVVIATRVLSAQGEVLGVLGGSVALQSAHLFSDLVGQGQPADMRTLVLDRGDVVLSHSMASRVLGRAADEVGLGAALAQWHLEGRAQEGKVSTQFSENHLVTLAPIAGSDWLLARLTPRAVAVAPLQAARQTANQVAVSVGLVTALLAGLLAWAVTRPITKLRVRAERMLTEVGSSADAWPAQNGEMGELAGAFQKVVAQRQSRQNEAQVLLQQLEAVLDHAEVGIALSRNGHFELVSRQFCRIFRCEKEHAVGQATRMIHLSDAAYQALSDRARPAFMEHGAFDGELELMRRSGQTFWAHMRGRAVAPGDRSQGTIWIIEDVTEQRELRERLTWTSSHDALTGLANRAAFEVLLEEATANAATTPFCALFIDLDRFKQVNDEGGHAAGDALLRDVARQLNTHVRKSDTVARLGGDEFAVLLHHCPLPQAQAIAEKLRSAVLAYELLWERKTFSVGTSIGLVNVDASYVTAADVLRAADAACYAAKREGRNCVALYAPPKEA